MGIGDRHSKRTDKPRPPSPIQRPRAIDAREPEDPLRARGDDDAGAHGPSHARPPAPAPAPAAEPRVARQPAAGEVSPAKRITGLPVFAEGSRRTPPLVDPVARHDIVLSRARTLDDPLTTRVLAEITRNDVVADRAERAPAPQRAATRTTAEKRAPALSGERTAASSPDTEVHDQRPVLGRRTTRRSIARDEPSRKK